MKKLTYLFALLLAMPFASCGDGKKEMEQKLEEKDRELAELRQLAELDRQEMENQYAQFAQQYDEMQRAVRDDSLVALLEAEKRRAQQLLTELRNTKSQNAAEILRLKKELETVRSVLRDYIRQVDSLQQRNLTLQSERDEARAEVERSQRENTGLAEQNRSLTEKVEIAAQLNATAISLQALKKNGKAAKKAKDVKNFALNFTIARNVTARTGNRTVYVRLMKPNQSVLGAAGTFHYENRTLEFSASKTVEYTGADTHVQVYVPSAEYLSAGRFTAYIFCDGQQIGSGSVTLE